jgi:hypothetical protein
MGPYPVKPEALVLLLALERPLRRSQHVGRTGFVIVVSDSSPLISLAKIQAFKLLDQLYGGVTISTEVFKEVVVSGAGLPGAAETSGSPWIKVAPINRTNDLTDAQGRFGLGLGELIRNHR